VDRRVLTELLAALNTACAGAVGFTDAPQASQLAFLLAACVFAALQTSPFFKKNLLIMYRPSRTVQLYAYSVFTNKQTPRRTASWALY
jgi:hypothetical protein